MFNGKYKTPVLAGLVVAVMTSKVQRLSYTTLWGIENCTLLVGAITLQNCAAL